MVLLFSVAVSYFVRIAHFMEGRQARRLKHGSARRGSGSSALSLQGLGMVCSLGSVTIRCQPNRVLFCILGRLVPFRYLRVG